MFSSYSAKKKMWTDRVICRPSGAGPLKGRIIPFRQTDPRNISPSLII